MLLCLHQSEGRTDVIIWSRGRDLSRGRGLTCILLCLDWLVCYAPLPASVWRPHCCDNLVKEAGLVKGAGTYLYSFCLDWLVCYAPLLASVWRPHWCDNLVKGAGLVKGVGTYLYSSLLRLASMLCSSACISLKAALMWWFSKTALSLYSNATSDLQ